MDIFTDSSVLFGKLKNSMLYTLNTFRISKTIQKITCICYLSMDKSAEMADNHD